MVTKEDSYVSEYMMVWAHTPSNVQLLIYKRILSVSNFLCCYDPTN